MKNTINNPFNSDLSYALYKTLLKRIPPIKFAPHLEDIVNLLTKALAKGELEVKVEDEFDQTQLKWPGWPESHLEALKKSGWTNNESGPIIFEDNCLSWRRWYEERNDVLKELFDRAKQNKTNCKETIVKFTQSLEKSLNQEQKQAVEAIENQHVIFISGGPGTGKTSTVLKMLERALLLSPDLRIGLAAPTGKAARRLQASLHKGIKTVDAHYQDAILKVSCSTLHKLLQSTQDGFGQNKQNPLNLDLLVIDEMSMVDLTLMKGLLEALTPSCQLILVGDPHQLPPVGSGSVWHYLHENKLPAHLEKSRVHLKKSYRNQGQIAVSSNLLKEKGLNSFFKLLFKSPKTSEVNLKVHICQQSTLPKKLLVQLHYHLNDLKVLTEKLIRKLPENIQSSREMGALEKESEDLFSCLDELMVLCPTRKGSWGVDAIHKAVLGKHFDEKVDQWPQGTPIMCCENLVDLELANGDIGIIMGERKNRWLVFQVMSEKKKLTTRLIHPARLKTISPAIALTVHKAQGSESNKLILLWPNHQSQCVQVNNNSSKKNTYDERLLYTAITRAKKKLDLFLISDI